MANRMKEDEKNERIIRGLLKLPANRRCINCNNLGPQYVCTNFWTFVCTNCSGIHREFTHRVKSISMAKFTSQEVITLQKEGNERAKEVYFKEWDPQRHTFPDSSNIDKLRSFIKHVYVDRKFTGEKNSDMPPRAKGDREDSYENRSGDSYRSESRSPPYNDRYSERSGYDGRNEARSPGYDSDYKRSPGQFEVVNERHQDDRFGNGNQNRGFEERRSPDGVSKPEGRSPNLQKDIASFTPPMVRPVKDILGNDMPTLRVGDPPKSNGVKIIDNSSPAQRASSSSSVGSSDGTSAQLKRVNSGSLIDFNADPEPPAPDRPQQSVHQQTSSAPADSGNWASFDIADQQKTTHTPQAVVATLQSALGQSPTFGYAQGGNTQMFPFSGVNYSNVNNNLPMMQQQRPSPFPTPSNQFSNPQLFAPTVGAVNQSWGSALAPNFQMPVTAPAGYPSQVATIPLQEKNAGVSSQPLTEAKPSGRNELPADIFASLYPSTLTSAPGWQRGPHVGIGYGSQYPTSMLQTMPMFPRASNPTNPFDLINQPASVQPPQFPSMASLQGALPNMAGPSTLLHPSTFGAPSLQWMPPQQPSYSSAASQNLYMMQQAPSNMPQQISNDMFRMQPQGIGGPGLGSGTTFGTSGMDQHHAARFPQPGTPNSFGSAGGNPFG